MHELDDRRVLDKVINSLKKQLDVHNIRKIAVGNEFYIFKARYQSRQVAIKIPKDRIFSNVNDAHIDSRMLLAQEFTLLKYVKVNGLWTTVEPISTLETEGFGALIMSYVPSDSSKPDELELGKLLARIHSMEPTGLHLTAQENMEIPELISNRLVRRWQELSRLVDKLPTLANREILKEKLEPIRSIRSLLHMDFRYANFRMQQRKVIALLDWSNALIGPPSLELARVAETGEVGSQFLEGYATVKALPSVSPVIEIIFRLDTATMLALVFLSEEPAPKRARPAIHRVRELHNKLMEELIH